MFAAGASTKDGEMLTLDTTLITLLPLVSVETTAALILITVLLCAITVILIDLKHIPMSTFASEIIGLKKRWRWITNGFGRSSDRQLNLRRNFMGANANHWSNQVRGALQGYSPTPTPPTPPGNLTATQIQALQQAMQARQAQQAQEVRHFSRADLFGLIMLIKEFGVDKIRQVSKLLDIGDDEIKHAAKTLAKIEKNDTELQEVIDQCAREISI